ncbi:VanZ family protein [Cohnella sp. AR92]|uniref:VanZ family protein n=1 Tax=Cohnella sp. AR92 TaxID=648716 RepID=UPI001315A1EA|nr:VanZ family protein [Cohnella sp. AR92]
MKRVRLIRTWRLLLPIILIGWLFMIFGFSSQPYQQQDIKPELKKLIPENVAERVVPDISFRYHNGIVSGKDNPYGFIEFFIRKGAHMFEYGLLGLLLYLLLYRMNGKGKRSVGALALAVAVALADESNQSHVANRTSTILDVGVDLLGASLSIGLVLLVSIKLKFR